MRIFSSYNIKGGVGKTATAVNLAYLSAMDGYKTLLIDLDPQGASSFYYRMDNEKHACRSIFTSTKKEAGEIDDHVKASDFEGLNLLPADASFRKIEQKLRETPHAGRIWQQKFKQLEKHYDVVILDCPPNLSLLSARIFQISNYILCPVIPTTLSLRTLGQLIHFMRNKAKLKTTILPFFSMVERRKKLHLQIMKYTYDGKLRGYPSFLQSPVPYLADVEKMGIKRAPLPSFLPHSPASKVYQSLWQEVETLTQGQSLS